MGKHGFRAVDDELKKQQAWINHLQSYTRDLHRYADQIRHSNLRHKEEIAQHLASIRDWIDYLNKSNRELRKEYLGIRSELKSMLAADFLEYHKLLKDYLSLRLEEENLRREHLKKEVAHEIKHELFNYISKVREETLPLPEADLTNPEREILNLLFNENKPMSYAALAEKTGKSVNSVRVYMNSMRAKKDIIDEFIAPGGVKVFSIRNSETVKKLLV